MSETPKKSLSSILKAAMEVKNAAAPKKKSQGRKKKVEGMGTQPTTKTTVSKPKVTRRSSRGG